MLRRTRSLCNAVKSKTPQAARPADAKVKVGIQEFTIDEEFGTTTAAAAAAAVAAAVEPLLSDMPPKNSGRNRASVSLLSFFLLFRPLLTQRSMIIVIW